MPAATSRSSSARLWLAGPRVQTILVRRTPATRAREARGGTGRCTSSRPGARAPRARPWPRPAPPRPTLRSEVDDPVGGLDDVQVVLDDHHRVALVHEAVEH